MVTTGRVAFAEAAAHYRLTVADCADLSGIKAAQLAFAADRERYTLQFPTEDLRLDAPSICRLYCRPRSRGRCPINWY
jgi:hypothetical protein